jgi:hypothetical protein
MEQRREANNAKEHEVKSDGLTRIQKAIEAEAQAYDKEVLEERRRLWLHNACVWTA